jgi:hypothetical protein
MKYVLYKIMFIPFARIACKNLRIAIFQLRITKNVTMGWFWTLIVIFTLHSALLDQFLSVDFVVDFVKLPEIRRTTYHPDRQQN